MRIGLLLMLVALATAYDICSTIELQDYQFDISAFSK